MSSSPKIPDYGNGKYIFELFPKEMIALQMELATPYHPDLANILAGYPAEETDIKIAQIASYCGVMLDDIYTFDDKVRLCKILTEKLILLRKYPDPSCILLLS